MIGNKIDTLKTEKKVSVKDIAEYLGVSRSLVSGWINEPTKRTPNPEQIKLLAKFFNVTADFLVNDNEMVETRLIPLIGKSSCGEPRGYELNGYDPIPIPNEMYKTGMYAIEAEGDSMSPKINNGDILYCCPNLQIENSNIVHYWLNGESGIKRYKINEAGTIISLIPINTEYDIITIHCDDDTDLRMSKVTGRIDKSF